MRKIITFYKSQQIFIYFYIHLLQKIIMNIMNITLRYLTDSLPNTGEH